MMLPIIYLLIYVVFTALTFWVVWQEQPKPMDYLVAPFISVLWPLSWSFIFLNEMIGFLRRKYGKHTRAKRLAKNHRQHEERRAKAYKKHENKWI